MDKKKIANVIATAAALAFVTAPMISTSVQAHTAKVKCYGGNSCKGHSACKTAKNECKGKNSCKGQGVTMMSPAKCKKMGGSEQEPAAS